MRPHEQNYWDTCSPRLERGPSLSVKLRFNALAYVLVPVDVTVKHPTILVHMVMTLILSVYLKFTAILKEYKGFIYLLIYLLLYWVFVFLSTRKL